MKNLINKNGFVIPDDERLWVTYQNVKGEAVYFLTGTLYRDKYVLYVNEAGKIKRLGECASPEKLTERFRVLESIKKV